MEEPSLQTYEQASALKLQSKAADPIHYNVKYSYRNSKYRHLYHQNGIIGHFKVRLVEAKNLKRWHWSVLGMGPVKLLGLSHAHGQVSSFAVMKLVFRSRRRSGGGVSATAAVAAAAEGSDLATTTTMDVISNSSIYDSNISWENDSIASALSASTTASVNGNVPSPLSFISGTNGKRQVARQQQQQLSLLGSAVHTKEYRSSVVRSNSNPSWPTVQSSSNVSIFNMALEKGIMPKDGMEIYLSIQMKEEWSAVDTIVPVKSGGDGMLGEAEINITPLVLRGFNVDAGDFHNLEEEEVDFLDEWVALNPPSSRSVERSTLTDLDNEEFNAAGKVRLIVSYEPNGFSPRRGDIVALEAFARQSVAMSTVRPIIHPSHPLRVRDIRGEYLLCSFDLPCCKEGNLGDSDNRRGNPNNKNMPIEGSIRLHRNTVFVIERTNLIDSAINVALKPADVVLSTHIGKEVTSTISPYVEAAGDVLMPAVLSTKLFFEAAKVGGSAVAVGLKSAVSSVAESQDPEKRRRMNKKSSSE